MFTVKNEDTIYNNNIDVSLVFSMLTLNVYHTFF